MNRVLPLVTLMGLSTVMAQQKPNILFIVIDDLGHDDMGFKAETDQLKTPNADKFAHGGAILDNMYVQPSCSPTRTTIMSGRYPLHTGVNNYIPMGAVYGLSPNETTMGDMLLAAGYETHAVGKWHCGMYSWKQTPTFRGFKSFYGFYGGGEDYYTHVAGGGFDFRRDVGLNCGPGCSVPDYGAKGKYSTQLFTTEAVNIVQKHDVSKPLFLYLAYQAVHAPAEAPENYVKPYTDMGLPHPRNVYGGMIAAMDEGIGNVTSALENKGMLDNTFMVFTADNGGPSETCARQGSVNYPLRGSKCSLWEGGTKAAAFAWTGKNLAHQIPAGIHFKDFMHAADWMPTVADVVGTTCPGCKKWDGVSQWRQLTKQESNKARDDVFYGITDAQVGVHGPALRYGCYKLIMGDGGKPGGWVKPPKVSYENYVAPTSFDFLWGDVPYPPNPNNTKLLFNLCEDPNEHHPLSVTDPENQHLISDLEQRIAKYWTTAEPGCPNAKCPGWGGSPTCANQKQGTNISGVITWVPWCN